LLPHLTHRRLIKFVDDLTPPPDLAEFEYVFTQCTRHQAGLVRQVCRQIGETTQNTELFQLRYQRDDVYLFVKKSWEDRLLIAVEMVKRKPQ